MALNAASHNIRELFFFLAVHWSLPALTDTNSGREDRTREWSASSSLGRDH
jgi:hypothetical protein